MRWSLPRQRRPLPHHPDPSPQRPTHPRLPPTTAPLVDQTRVSFRTGKASGALTVRGDGLADLTLSALTASDGTAATGGFGGARRSGTPTSRPVPA